MKGHEIAICLVVFVPFFVPEKATRLTTFYSVLLFFEQTPCLFILGQTHIKLNIDMCAP